MHNSGRKGSSGLLSKSDCSEMTTLETSSARTSLLASSDALRSRNHTAAIKTSLV